MDNRVILHVDANSFYASVEQAENPALRGKAISVGGDAEKRHGIVLASSREAKAFGIKTGMTILDAARKCPWLTVLPARFKVYEKYSGRLHGMLKSVQALEKGLIPPSRGWTVEKAGQLLSAAAARPKLAFPPGITEDMVFEVVREILLQLEDAEEQYIPKWAKLLRS